mmetsp:Transcript_5929/g.22504  ORF Transcript_5929/g.22504 Transcript_5929/m.22504 type:complete len:90 (+) Transcript_5929:383-652(+)
MSQNPPHSQAVSGNGHTMPPMPHHQQQQQQGAMMPPMPPMPPQHQSPQQQQQQQFVDLAKNIFYLSRYHVPPRLPFVRHTENTTPSLTS